MRKMTNSARMARHPLFPLFLSWGSSLLLVPVSDSSQGVVHRVFSALCFAQLAAGAYQYIWRPSVITPCANPLVRLVIELLFLPLCKYTFELHR